MSSTPYKKTKEFPAGSFAYVNLDNLDMKIENYFAIYDGKRQIISK